MVVKSDTLIWDRTDEVGQSINAMTVEDALCALFSQDPDPVYDVLVARCAAHGLSAKETFRLLARSALERGVIDDDEFASLVS